MVFTIGDVKPEMYPTPDRFCPDEPEKEYVFMVNPAESRIQEIEDLYGPFTPVKNVSSSNSSMELSNQNEHSLRPLTRNREDVLLMKQLAIERLKEVIARKEAIQESAKKNLVPLTIKQTQPKLKNKAEGSTLKNTTTATIKLKPSSLYRKPAATCIVIDDSDDDMASLTDEENAVSAESEEAVSIDKEEAMSTEKEKVMSTEREEAISADKEGTMYTDKEEVMSTEKEVNTSMESEEEDIAEDEMLVLQEKTCDEQLAKLKAVIQSSKLNLLGMKARLSMINKKEKKNTSSTSTIPPSGNKRMKRPSPDIEARLQPQAKMRYTNNYRNTPVSYGFSNVPNQPFYQQSPAHSILNQPYIPPPTTFLPYQQPPPPTFIPTQPLPPPPPPPNRFRPTTPPPPPPPPPASSTTNLPQPRPHITEEISDVEPLKDAIIIKNILKDVEQLISLRVFSDALSNLIIPSRPVPRPIRLVTIDKYTMPMHMILINEDKDVVSWEPPSTKFTLPAGVPVETEMADTWYESPFFIMLRRKATSQPANAIITPMIQAIIETIQPTDDLSTIKAGNIYFVNLQDTLQLVRTFAYQHPQNEFLAALKLELSNYVYGNTKMFTDDYKETVALIPLSVDVEWQRIRAEATFSSQLPLVLDLLHRISLLHTSFVSKESLSVSSMTLEVLIRLLRLNGLQQVLRLLSNIEIEIDSEQPTIIDMDDTPGLYLQEHDKYSIWMLVLYYFISKSLPESVCSTWMGSLVKDGTPTKSMASFMIDWNNSNLLQQPLDRPTLFGATNILLSMLRHFGKKACNDARRKPLLVGVLRTFFNFLSYNPSYKNTGTLLLVRKMSEIIEQIPEIQEIIIDLEIKLDSPGTNIVKQVYRSKKIMSLSNIYSLSYHVARSYYEHNKFSKQLLLIISNFLSYPLLEYNTENIQLEIIKQLTNPETMPVPEDKIIYLVDTIRAKYLTEMGLDPHTTTPLQNTQKSRITALRKSTFAWINLLLLTVISHKNAKAIFEQGMKNIDSEEGKLVMFKYSQQLL